MLDRYPENGPSGVKPYFYGALTGLLMLASIVVAGKYFGASTSYARAAGMLEQLVAPEHVRVTAYFQKYAAKDSGLLFPDWQLLFVVGILLGAFISAKLSGTFKRVAVPPMWADRFGHKPGLRAAFAFLGGAVALFGVRMAGGCPSGHGLSGLMQLSLSGYVAMACFFGAGIVTARLIYGAGR